MSTYVVGDIQGCFEEFMSLLQVVDYRPGEDELWLLGDLINRGPDNVKVMDFVMDTPNVIAVQGNHDLHFLAVARGHHRAHRGDTFQDLIDSPRKNEYIEYVRQLTFIHHRQETVMVHAGLPPWWNLPRCLELAAEVESVLQSGKLDTFLANMYGNEPDRWNDDLSGSDRWRFITNSFTRMRYCTIDGKLELLEKTNDCPDGFSPWYVFERPGTETILFGHWAALEGKADSPFAIALDTGCVWGRTLTAMRLEDKKIFSVPALNKASDA